MKPLALLAVLLTSIATAHPCDETIRVMMPGILPGSTLIHTESNWGNCDSVELRNPRDFGGLRKWIALVRVNRVGEYEIVGVDLPRTEREYDWILGESVYDNW